MKEVEIFVELIKLYIISDIFRMLIDIYNVAFDEGLNENTTPLIALQYLTYRNLIPDELGDSIFFLLDNKEVNLDINKIQQGLLEIKHQYISRYE